MTKVKLKHTVILSLIQKKLLSNNLEESEMTVVGSEKYGSSWLVEVSENEMNGDVGL